MLRVILGGVALAATGYGIKKYLEEDEVTIHGIPDEFAPFFFNAKTDHADTQISDDKVNHENSSSDLSNESEFFGESSSALKNNSLQSNENALEPLIQVKEKLANTLFREIEGVKRTVKNLPYKEPLESTNNTGEIQTLEVTPENSAHIVEFCLLLQHSRFLQNTCLDYLLKAFLQTDDFEQLSGIDRDNAIQLVTFDEAIHEACNCVITFDGIEVSKLAIRTFRKLGVLIQKQMNI